MKLHLGCGQKYLEGYTNIDFPSTEHTVQNTTVADEFHNLYELRYPSETIDEVRLHHVFEHFDRATVCAFMASWNSWLKPGGKLHIEVPDFENTFKKNMNLFNREKFEGVALRHIFGSQEASWAVHYEGYSEKLLIKVFNEFGFKVRVVNKTEYKRTFNIEVIGEKDKSLDMKAARLAASNYLKFYLVDDSPSESQMHGVWLSNFEKQLERSFAE
jgi:predicted SAM-dependent methyltransferase